jgi:DNA-binding beta-propeller fold protein YncE
MAVDPTGKFLYVVNNGSDTVSAYVITSITLLLSPQARALTAAGSAVAAGTNPGGIAVDPTGKFVYVANGNSGNISVYTINPSTGALSEVKGSPFAAGSGPFSVAIATVTSH